jgi:hypothetical protein
VERIPWGAPVRRPQLSLMNSPGGRITQNVVAQPRVAFHFGFDSRKGGLFFAPRCRSLASLFLWI